MCTHKMLNTKTSSESGHNMSLTISLQDTTAELENVGPMFLFPSWLSVARNFY